MKRSIGLCCAAALMIVGFSGLTHAVETIEIKIGDDAKLVKVSDKNSPFTGKRAAVDVAVLLDTSNSMDGLISQAKSQLWTIVQEFAAAKKAGQTPVLRVALFEYGNSDLPASEGYIRQVVQLTDDLDEVSKSLFSLKTHGGDEYCGQVIDEAVKRLDWVKDANSYKAIFVCGNEPFTQGSVKYQDSCKGAIGKGIVVNTVHCGSYSDGVSGQWEAAASMSEGKFLNINQDKKIVHIKCPQDKLILELNGKLNKTYLWFGDATQRAYYARNQVAQDENARHLSESVLLSRAAAKSGAGYGNSKRDLIDAMGADADALSAIPEAKLPTELQKMKPADRAKHIDKLTAERKLLQQQIAKLNKERAEYIAKQRKAEAGDKDATLGDAFIDAVRLQLKESGFEVAK